MRGSTVKKINKFVDLLIANTPKDQITKTRSQLVDEVKKFWYKDPKARKFVHKVVNGEIGEVVDSVKG